MKKIMSLSLLLITVFCFNACLGSSSSRTKTSEAEENSSYNRSKKASYENRIRYSAFAPFYYSLAYTPSNPDKKGYS